MKLASIVALSVVLHAIVASAQSASPTLAVPSEASEDALTNNFAVCAIAPIMPTMNGILHYCDIYESSCSDVSFDGFDYFPDYYYDGYDCESCYHCKCQSTALRHSLSWENFAPLRRKVPIERLPDGLNPNLKIAKSVYARLKGDENTDIYFRIFKFVYIDASRPTLSRSFSVGMEMETPSATESLPNHQSLVDLKDCSALSQNVYALKKGNETFLLLRAGVPTPASQQAQLIQ
jgi:hypothetical protein